MKKIETGLVGMKFSFEQLESALKNNGFVRGAMWDWDYATFDHALVKSTIGYYTYLRVTTEAVSGEIEQSDCEVKITDVIITEAKYHSGLHVDKTVNQAQANQALSILKSVINDLHVSAEVSARDAKDEEKNAHRGVRVKH